MPEETTGPQGQPPKKDRAMQVYDPHASQPDRYGPGTEDGERTAFVAWAQGIQDLLQQQFALLNKFDQRL